MASDGSPVYLKDIWPTEDEIQQYIAENVTGDLFKEKYADVFKGSGENVTGDLFKEKYADVFKGSK